MKLDLDAIRDLCTESSFERGIDYYDEERVEIVSAAKSKVEAIIAGTRDYKVEIDTDDPLAATCNCPYDWGGYCKHIVATMLVMVYEGVSTEALIENKESQYDKALGILKEVPPEELKAFLAEELERFPDLISHLVITFSDTDEGKSIHDYKKEIERHYRVASDRYGIVDCDKFIDFSSFEDTADLYLAKGAYLEAAKIYRALFETIAENMNNVDDSYGHYGDTFCISLEKFGQCIEEAELDFDAKKDYIQYLFEKYMERDPDYFEDDYFQTLQKLCKSEDDLRYWKELLEPYLSLSEQEENAPRSHSRTTLLLIQIYLLIELEEAEELNKLMEDNYTVSEELCLMHVEQLKNEGKLEEALKVAEEGIKLFKRPLDLIRFVNPIYRITDIEKYKENLLTLFLSDTDWKSYNKLKRISSQEEWDASLEKILKHLSERRYDTDRIIKIYLEEEMPEKALELVLSRGNLGALMQYHGDLSTIYPAAYFEAYRELVLPFVESKTGRPHYKKAVVYLKKMKTIEGFEDEFDALMTELRDAYSGRPAFIEEIGDL